MLEKLVQNWTDNIAFIEHSRKEVLCILDVDTKNTTNKFCLNLRWVQDLGDPFSEIRV